MRLRSSMCSLARQTSRRVVWCASLVCMMDHMLKVAGGGRADVRSNPTVNVKVLEDKNNREAVEDVFRGICKEAVDPFFLLDLGNVVASYKTWEHHLGGIRPYYGESAISLTTLLTSIKINVTCMLDFVLILATMGCSSIQNSVDSPAMVDS